MANVKAVYLHVPQELWDRIDKARWILRTKTDRETYFRLWEIALETLENKEKQGS